MFYSRIVFTIGLLGSVFIVSSGAINAQQTNNSSQNSFASIDQQMSDNARKPPRGSSFYYGLTRKIIPSWETTVDAAGLHTLLNQNQKAYTLFKPGFDKISKGCYPKRSRSLTGLEAKVEQQKISQCVGMSRKNLTSLFAIENQSDLQRVLKCHVVPQKIILKDLPNDKELIFRTMEPSCTITVRAKHSQIPEMRAIIEKTNGWDSSLNVRTTGQNTRYVPTGKIENYTQLFVNNSGTGGRFRTDEISKGVGNYITYDSFIGVIIPPDLKSKYGGSPASGRPLTD
jgi:uncharacterized surface protein with fasciclin (FAS1) repeats